MKQYLDLLKHVLENGERKGDPQGVGNIAVCGYQMRFKMDNGFPLLTTKKVYLKAIIYELLWFLKGDTNVKYLKDHGVSIWDEWAKENGELGPVYGYQWRHWGKPYGEKDKNQKGIDQISRLISDLKNNPQSRRHIVSAWNVADIEQMALPPCHVLFQFYVHEDGRLSCQLYQRSADVFLGVPFNIASYSLLTLMVAQVVGLKPGFFVHTFGDVHLYLNHTQQAKLQISREPKKLPILKMNSKVKSIFEFAYEDFVLEGYDFHPAISAPIAV